MYTLLPQHYRVLDNEPHPQAYFQVAQIELTTFSPMKKISVSMIKYVYIMTFIHQVSVTKKSKGTFTRKRLP